MADVVQGVAWAADASSEAAKLKALGQLAVDFIFEIFPITNSTLLPSFFLNR